MKIPRQTTTLNVTAVNRVLTSHVLAYHHQLPPVDALRCSAHGQAFLHRLRCRLALDYDSGAHSLNVLSYEHVTMYLSSGEMSTPMTLPSCPASVFSGCQLGWPHTCAHKQATSNMIATATTTCRIWRLSSQCTRKCALIEQQDTESH